MNTSVAPTTIAAKFARNSRRALAASIGTWRASNRPHDASGGTRAAAMATPTMMPAKPGETNVTPPATPPTNAISRSRMSGDVLLRTSLPIERARVGIVSHVRLATSADKVSCCQEFPRSRVEKTKALDVIVNRGLLEDLDGKRERFRASVE
jgi:hypothetical protein